MGKNQQGAKVGSMTRLTLSQRPISSPQQIIRGSAINLFRTRHLKEWPQLGNGAPVIIRLPLCGGAAGRRESSSLVWLQDGYSQIFRSYVVGPWGFWTMAPLRYTAKLDPFLSTIQGKEGIKFWQPCLPCMNEKGRDCHGKRRL